MEPVQIDQEDIQGDQGDIQGDIQEDIQEDIVEERAPVATQGHLEADAALAQVHVEHGLRVRLLRRVRRAVLHRVHGRGTEHCGYGHEQEKNLATPTTARHFANMNHRK